MRERYWRVAESLKSHVCASTCSLCISRTNLKSVQYNPISTIVVPRHCHGHLNVRLQSLEIRSDDSKVCWVGPRGSHRPQGAAAGPGPGSERRVTEARSATQTETWRQVKWTLNLGTYRIKFTSVVLGSRFLCCDLTRIDSATGVVQLRCMITGMIYSNKTPHNDGVFKQPDFLKMIRHAATLTDKPFLRIIEGRGLVARVSFSLRKLGCRVRIDFHLPKVLLRSCDIGGHGDSSLLKTNRVSSERNESNFNSP